MAERPYRISERYSSQDLSGENSGGLDHGRRHYAPTGKLHGPKAADRPRLGTPDPRTAVLPSPVLTAEFATDGPEGAASRTNTTELITPDMKVESDEDGGIVRSVAISDPFANPHGSSAGAANESTEGAFFAAGRQKRRSLPSDVLESVELPHTKRKTKSKRMLSQEETDYDLPASKRRRMTAPAQPVPPVQMRENAVEGVEQDGGNGIEGNNNEGAAQCSEGDLEDETAEEGQTGDVDDSTSSRDQEHISDHEDDGEDSDYETNSDWDHLEAVRDALAGYQKFKLSIKGHEKWTKAQAKLHKLIALRGCWPMFDQSWALDFSTRNIYPTVYAPAGTRKRVAITSKTNKFRTTRALEAIFDLSALVRSYRQSGIEHKIGGILKKALKRYIKWAVDDAGVADRFFIPTLEVYEFDPMRWAEKAKASRTSAPTTTTTTVVKTEAASDDWAPDDSEAESDSDPISDEVERRLRRLAARHRADLVRPGSRHLPEYMWTYARRPPLLFAFVVLQHMVMVVSVDSSRPDNDIIVFAELDMSLADQWLWNALAIALPVHMARDALWERRERFPLVERMEVDDPDL